MEPQGPLPAEDVFQTSEGEPPPAPLAKAKRRFSALSVVLFGGRVCYQAARRTIGVGSRRLQHSRQGLVDGWCERHPDRNASAYWQLRYCCAFLWNMYRQAAEGFPDALVFNRGGPNRTIIYIHPLKSARPRPTPRDSGALEAGAHSDLENAVEAGATSGVAMSAAAVRAPDAKAAIGPGASQAP